MVRISVFPPLTLLAVLQWSHVFSDMVRRAMVLGAFGGVLLQWSHVFSDMVSRPVEGTIKTLTIRFNGAMSFQTW